MSEFFQRLARKAELCCAPLSAWRRAVFALRGARIGSGTRIPPRTRATWPHQIKIGRNCILQSDIFFNYDHYWVPGPSILVGDGVFIGRGCEFNIRKRLVVGEGALIASGCTFIDHDHGRDAKTGRINEDCPGEAIHIEEGAWIGANCTILKGVRIGKNSVVGAAAVVTKSVPDGEVWAGNPARPLK